MKKVSLLIVVFSLLLLTCELLDEITDTSSKKFWARNFSSSTYYKVDAQLLAKNDLCYVWAEKGSGVTEAMARNIANEYRNNIYRKIMNTFGYTIDDKDLGKLNTMEIAHYLATREIGGAKLTILLLDIKDGYKTIDDPYVGGYFYALDLYEHSLFKYSNELDMIYLDTYPSDLGSTSSYSTLAHEMQHLMNFVSTLLYREDLMDTWIDEGLSSAAEWVYTGQHPEVRWKYYNKDPSKLIAKGNNFFVWDNRGDDSPLANLDDYATVYLFFQWLRLQSGKSDDIYYDIHTSEFYDYKAVTTAENINNSHKDNWPLLLRDWYAANYTNNTSGLYGYMNDLILKDIKAPIVPDGITSLALFPGEGVYSITPAVEFVPIPSGYINYSGLSSTGSDPNDTTGYENGARLTYNVDTDTSGESATGSTTGIAPSGDSPMPDDGRSAQNIGSNKFSGPFQVDAGYFLKKGNNSAPDTEIRSVFNGSNGRSINQSNSIFKFDKSKIERVFINE